MKNNLLARIISGRKNRQDEIKSCEEKLLESKRNVKFLSLLVVILCILLVFAVYYANYVEIPTYKKQSQFYDQQLDNYFTEVYEKDIQDIGEKRINYILNEVKNISDPYEKLERIAQWETENITDMFWERSIQNNKSYTWPWLGNYQYNENNQYRATGSAKYTNNATWIAGNNMGNCGDIAALFDYVANQSGFETRTIHVVYSDQAYSDGHVWNEIKINGVWVYFDIDRYGQAYRNISGNQYTVNYFYSTWNGKTSEYSIINNISYIYANDLTSVKEEYSSLKYNPNYLRDWRPLLEIWWRGLW
jgi:transglutaminase-like putative cysteine protease